MSWSGNGLIDKKFCRRTHKVAILHVFRNEKNDYFKAGRAGPGLAYIWTSNSNNFFIEKSGTVKRMDILFLGGSLLTARLGT